jgi:tetratricopeptide (TPR) repeat protein
VYEVGDHQGRPFFSLEYVEGGALDGRLNGTPQPPREAARITKVLAAAIHTAHGKDIVHRDLKPGNVLLAADGTPKITDFGLAKHLGQDSNQTKSGSILGTPSYMAPEQAWGKPGVIGPATDVYALGAILYELLTGRPPFRAATPMDTMVQVISSEPVVPSRLQPTVPRDLETICLKCLRKEPGKRYGNALELADDLERFLNKEPIRARPTPWWERQWKWAKRRPAVAALVVIFAMLPALLMFTFIQWRGAAEARDQADRTALREKSEHLRAQEQVKNAGVALDRILDRVASDRLARIPGFQEERRFIVEEVLKYYQSLLELKANAQDPTIRRETGRVYCRCLELYMILGRSDLAGAAGRKALELQESLAAEFPGWPEYRNDLAKTQIEYAASLAMENRIDQALRAYARALEISEQLTRESPKEADFQTSLALANINLGYFHMISQPQQAEPYFRKALALAEQLQNGQPRSADYQVLLAWSCANLGRVFLATGRLNQAEQILEKSLAILKPAGTAGPREAKGYDQVVADALICRGSVHFRKWQNSLAERKLQEGIKLLEEIHRGQPKFFPTRIQLGMAQMTLAGVWLVTNQNAKAEETYRQSLKLLEELLRDTPQLRPYLEPAVQAQRINLLVLRARSGQPREVTAEVRQLARSSPPTGMLAYNLACVYARATAAIAADPAIGKQEKSRLVDQYVTQAIDWLSKSRAGYLKSRRSIQYLKEDPDLDSLRSRPEFKRFLAELEKKVSS